MAVYFPSTIEKLLDDNSLYLVKVMNYYFDVFYDNNLNNESDIRSAVLYMDIVKRGSSDSLDLSSAEF